MEISRIKMENLRTEEGKKKLRRPQRSPEYFLAEFYATRIWANGTSPSLMELGQPVAMGFDQGIHQRAGVIDGQFT